MESIDFISPHSSSVAGGLKPAVIVQTSNRSKVGNHQKSRSQLPMYPYPMQSGVEEKGHIKVAASVAQGEKKRMVVKLKNNISRSIASMEQMATVSKSPNRYRSVGEESPPKHQKGIKRGPNHKRSETTL